MNENYDSIISDFCTALIEKILSATKFTEKSINKTIRALHNIIQNRTYFQIDLQNEFAEEFSHVILLCIRDLDTQPKLVELLHTNMELLSLFGLKSRHFFLDSLLEQINNIANNYAVYVPVYDESHDKKHMITKDDYTRAVHVFFRMLSFFLQRYIVRPDHYVYRQLAEYLLNQPPLFELSDILDAMMYLIPKTESNSWMLILALSTFILNKMDLFDTENYLDYYCSQCFTKFTKRISPIVLNNIGKNIVPFMSKFAKINTKAPKFLSSYFALIGSFIKNDFDVALLCASLISNSFKYFYMIDEFIDFCTFLATGYKDFWQKLLSTYGQYPEYFIALQKINQSFWPERVFLEETPPEILLQISLNKPKLDSEVKSLIWSNFDALLSSESFTLNVEHYIFFFDHGYSIDQYITNFPTQVLIQIFQTYPKLLTENMLRILCRSLLFDQTKRDPELCRLLYLSDFFDSSFPAYVEVISTLEEDKNSPFDTSIDNPVNKIRSFYKLNSGDDELFLCKLQQEEFRYLFKDDDCINLVHALLDTHPFQFDVLSSIIEIISRETYMKLQTHTGVSSLIRK